MFWYKYNEQYVIIEKSNTELTGNMVATYEFDIDIELYDVVIAALSSDNTQIVKYTSLPKTTEILIQKIKDKDQVMHHLKNVYHSLRVL
jgi:hypothetical protein